MTGYTVHTGSNDKFRDGWDNIFGGKKKAAKKTKAKEKGAKKSSTAKKSKTKK